MDTVTGLLNLYYITHFHNILDSCYLDTSFKYMIFKGLHDFPAKVLHLI